ncbi:class I adenylate-forming enzyme family protein [Bacteroidota bacterium]
MKNFNNQAVYRFLNDVAGKYPDKKAVICETDSCTYIELQHTMNNWALVLLSLGVKKGDRVAFFMKNRVELVELYFACFRMGAIAVPLNTRYAEAEAEYALNQSGSKILIVSSELFPVVKNIKDKVESLENLYIIDENTNYESLSWKNIAVDKDISIPEPQMQDAVIIIYTSGSTGHPKGVVHTNYSISNHILNKTESQDLDEREVALAGTQISHIAGFAALLIPTLANGGLFTMVPEFEPGKYIQYLKNYKPTFMVLLPTELLEVLEHPNVKDADFSRLHSMLIGGDKVSNYLYELFRKNAGFDLMEGCGMTECEGYCCQPRHGKKIPGSIGMATTGVEIRLVNSQLQDVAIGETGEIWLKAKSVMPYYWNNPEETKKAYVDGWFRTGDLAYEDKDGYYYFVSRIKELIIRGGSNIAPGEVESVIDDHPAVELCGVVGFPDEHYGSIVGAFIVPKDGITVPSTEELIKFAAKKLAQYMIPEKWIFVKSLPRNAVGKIDRKKLHEIVKEQKYDDL